MNSTQHNSLRPNPSGDMPVIHRTAYVDSTAQVIGRVEIGARVYIGPNAVIRADEPDENGKVAPIIIADDCNIQDSVIVHALGGTGVTVAPRSSLSHGVIVHGPCTIGEGCFVGFGAVVFNASLGSGVFVAPRAVVENVAVPPERFIPAASAIAQDEVPPLRQTDPGEHAFMAKVVKTNIALAEGYLALEN